MAAPAAFKLNLERYCRPRHCDDPSEKVNCLPGNLMSADRDHDGSLHANDDSRQAMVIHAGTL